MTAPQKTSELPDSIAGQSLGAARGSALVASRWSHHIYPCSEGCGFIGSLDAFTWGECYNPCPNCGARRQSRTGRFLYRVESVPWLPFIKRKRFVRVEWREEPNAPDQRPGDRDATKNKSSGIAGFAESDG